MHVDRRLKACGSFPSHLKHSRPPSPLSSRLFTEALGNCLRYLPFFSSIQLQQANPGRPNLLISHKGLIWLIVPRCNMLVIWTAASPLHTFISPIVILPSCAFPSCSESSWQTNQKLVIEQTARRLFGWRLGVEWIGILHLSYEVMLVVFIRYYFTEKHLP